VSVTPQTTPKTRSRCALRSGCVFQHERHASLARLKRQPTKRLLFQVWPSLGPPSRQPSYSFHTTFQTRFVRPAHDSPEHQQRLKHPLRQTSSRYFASTAGVAVLRSGPSSRAQFPQRESVFRVSLLALRSCEVVEPSGPTRCPVFLSHLGGSRNRSLRPCLPLPRTWQERKAFLVKTNL